MGVIIPDPNTMKSNATTSSMEAMLRQAQWKKRYDKLTMPKFNGSNNPEEYLSGALRDDKIFRLHNYEEEKKMAMASLEFQDYVLIWWEQIIERGEARGEPPITTWEQMKDVMRA